MKKLVSIVIFLILALASVDAQELITLGAPGKEGELIYPREIRVGPDGNIYVYDEVDAFIKVYSPQGQYLRKMGGEGQGPGEIQRRDGVSFGFMPEGKLFFTEYFRGHPWITLLELTGKLVRVLKLELTESFGVPDAVSLPEGGFIAEFHFSGEQEKQKDYYLYKSPIKLFLLDSEAKFVSEIKKTNHYTRISYRPDGADSGLPFTPRFNWCLYKNKTVLFADGLSNHIEVYDFSGNLLKEILAQIPEPEKVKAKDLDNWREERKQATLGRNPGWYHQFGSVIEKYTSSIYKTKPMIGGLALTPDGNIFVSGVWDSEKGTSEYWLLDESGKVLAQMNSAVANITISKSYIFFVTADEEMNVKVRCLKRRANEKEDILKLSRNF